MKLPRLTSKIKYVVIIGYVLLIAIMIFGLVSVYRNLVSFSEKKTRKEDLSELIIVGNTLSKLYEIESSQNLLNADLAEEYFQKYDLILPEVTKNIDSLKALSNNPVRQSKLDTIVYLLERKEQNLREITVLLDSVKKAPSIKREVQNSVVPNMLNKDIRDYLKKKIEPPKENTSKTDTAVIKGQKKGFFDRVRNVFKPNEDSVVMIKEQTSSIVETDSFKFVIDTVVKMVRYSERLDLARQRKFQEILMARQLYMNNMNAMLTSRIDDLLKGIENEELEKSIQLLSDKNKALSDSQRTVYLVSWLAILIAVIFGLLYLADITRSQRYRRQLEESNKRIRQLLDSRERLMLSISHDIKAPMSSILGYIELMLPPIGEEKKSLYLNNMKKSSEHVLQLVMNLLDYHKLESGKWTHKEITYNVRDLVENTADSFRPLAEQKELQFIVDNKIDRELVNFGDPYMVRQILSNLISNAIKFTHKGSVTVSASQEEKNKQPFLKLRISDTGVGIHKEDQSLVFHEFKQIVENDVLHSAQGSGLGLAIVTGLLDELGGSVTLDSEKGKGAEFTVLLPMKKASKASITDALNRKNISYDFGGISVLLVDDDPVQLTMMSEMLKTKNASVIKESNPHKVLGLLKENRFDLIFIDIQMPLMNGFELVNHIRKSSDADYAKTVPIIALSAKSGVSTADLESAGFSAFMTKPFALDQLFFNVYHFAHKQPAKKTREVVSGKSKDAGITALIDFVKDDKNASLDILNAFVDDTGKNTEKLKTSFIEYDQMASSQFAHKMLPLFRMIGDEKLIKHLSNLENKVKLTPEEKEATLKLLEKYIDEAGDLISDMEKA